MTRRLTLQSLLAVLTLAASPAAAQVFGTFPWQMQPYCNTVTLTLTNTPTGFTLDGIDDQCGATNDGSAVGTASFNASGNVTLSFTIVTAPSGKPVHVSAVVSPANGSGTWTDSVGNSGTFAFYGATPGLPARPLPASGLPPLVVTTTELASNAVTGAKVADASIASTKLSNGPRGAFAGGDQSLALTSTPAVARTLTLTAPSAGTVIVSASGYFAFTNTAATAEMGRCSITTGTGIDFSSLIISADGASTQVDEFSAWGATRGFSVAAGAFVVNLVCDQFAGTVFVRDTNLSAVFVAQ